MTEFHEVLRLARSFLRGAVPEAVVQKLASGIQHFADTWMTRRKKRRKKKRKKKAWTDGGTPA